MPFFKFLGMAGYPIGSDEAISEGVKRGFRKEGILVASTNALGKVPVFLKHVKDYVKRLRLIAASDGMNMNLRFRDFLRNLLEEV